MFSPFKPTKTKATERLVCTCKRDPLRCRKCLEDSKQLAREQAKRKLREGRT